MSNIFEIATREAYRFFSEIGALTTEQLWELPLKKVGGKVDLDKIARAVNNDLKELTEESFVDVKPSAHKKHLENKLEIVKHIIAVKQDEEEKSRKRAANQVELKRLKEIKDSKKQESLLALSEADIDARIAALEGNV